MRRLFDTINNLMKVLFVAFVIGLVLEAQAPAAGNANAAAAQAAVGAPPAKGAMDGLEPALEALSHGLHPLAVYLFSAVSMLTVFRRALMMFLFGATFGRCVCYTIGVVGTFAAVSGWIFTIEALELAGLCLLLIGHSVLPLLEVMHELRKIWRAIATGWQSWTAVKSSSASDLGDRGEDGGKEVK
jgi:hypothetical protein